MASINEVTNASLGLKRYLSNDGIDPVRYDYMVPAWFYDKYRRLGNGMGYSDLSPEQKSEFLTWLKDNYDQVPEEDQEPNQYYSDVAVVPADTWLIHFSDNAFDIVRDGFTQGAYDDQLHLTRLYKNRRTNDGPWVFAFIAGTRDAHAAAISGNYGSAAVMFKSSAAIEAWHSSDEENQVIIDRTELKPTSMVYLYQLDSEWAVGPASHPFIHASIDEVMTWVEDNYDQYHHQFVIESIITQLIEDDRVKPAHPGEISIDYAKSWFKSIDKIQRGLEPLIIDNMKKFVLSPGDPRYRYHTLARYQRQAIDTIDLFHYRGTLYKAVFKRDGNHLFMLWLGSHEAYNKLIKSDWLKRV